jgi:hypothetical protein
MCLLIYVLNCEQNLSFFLFGSRISDTRINCNRITEGLLYLSLTSCGLWSLKKSNEYRRNSALHGLVETNSVAASLIATDLM